MESEAKFGFRDCKHSPYSEYYSLNSVSEEITANERCMDNTQEENVGFVKYDEEIVQQEVKVCFLKISEFFSV